MRLVNVDELIEQEKVFAEKYKGDFGEQVATHVIEILTNAPTADDWQKYSDALWKKAYERGKSDAVRHGHWIGISYGGYSVKFPFFDEWKCSECGAVVEDSKPHYKYCPYCGAKMDSERKEE